MNLRIALAPAALALAAVASTASAATGAAGAACGTIPGPAWSNPALGQKGSTYRVYAIRVTCAYAKTSAGKLVKTPYKGEAGTRLVGPTGWSCLPSISFGRGTVGGCSKGNARFYWEVNAPKS